MRRGLGCRAPRFMLDRISFSDRIETSAFNEVRLGRSSSRGYMIIDRPQHYCRAGPGSIGRW
jgi:hypothetical protein